MTARAASIVVTVTSAGDPADGSGECPSEDACTLRRAIELINAMEGDDAVTITFDPLAFQPGSPAVITVTGSALPAITRGNVTVDGAGAGVIVDGSALSGTEDGLAFDGTSPAVRGMEVFGFPGTCIEIRGVNGAAAGDPAAGTGNRVGGCDVGIRVTGAGASLRGNVAGFAGDGTSPRPLRVGIEVSAASVTIGGTGIDAALANVVGNADIAILVGGSSSDPFSGVVIARNRLGEDLAGTAATIERGVLLASPSVSTRVTENTITGATVSAVAVADGTSGNSIILNTFRNLTGLAIDLGDDRVADPNDVGDADTGANGRLNHPEITRPVQAAIQGTACAGCRIDLYSVNHVAGGASDYPATHLVVAIADAGGSFTFGSPPVSPGDWVVATATDADSNTSEFSPPVRVGAGAILCGNLSLNRGWNQAGYFGAGSTALGATFPGDPSGRIRAVYHLESDGTYSHWFRDTAIGQTLTSVEPGLSYWFLVDEPVTLTSGFSLTAPLGIQLRQGWNEFVYFGASAAGLDAFASLAGSGATIYHFAAEGGGGEWQRWGANDSPAYVREFETVEACESFTVFMQSAAVLRPLHP